jgi:hypothetical protein
MGAGETGLDAGQVAESVGLPATLTALSGLVSDLDRVADVLYGRVGATAGT